MVNFNDIAKLAKVSPTTVSHVINQTRVVSPESKRRVLTAIKKLNYRPNLLARSLATGKTNTVGLIVSDIKNPFFSELFQGAEECALENNYNIFLCNTDYDLKRSLKYLSILIDKKVDGIIVSCSQTNNLLKKELNNSKIPFVIVDSSDINIKEDNIYIDFKTGIEDAISYLISLGHKKIYFVSSPKTLITARTRVRIFSDCINKFNKENNLIYKIIEGDSKISGGFKCVEQVLEEEKKLPSAIIFSNDLMAIGALKFFKIKGIRVPEDLSIIGLDNIILTEILSPSLTTIELERYKIGKTSMDLLLNRIKNNNLPGQKVVFDTKLIIRESTSKYIENK